jgi:hypothetical protein
VTDITLTQDCADIPDDELGPKVKQPMIEMAKAQAEQEGVTLIDDPIWESFLDDDGKRYAIKLTWGTR